MVCRRRERAFELRPGLDLFYLDGKGQTVFSEHVPFDELFLRKLVDATMVRNQLWVHEHHENQDFQQAAIYVQPWTTDEVDEYGPAIEQTLFEKVDVSPYYEIQWYVWNDRAFRRWRVEAGEYALHCASIMLDHVHLFENRRHDVQYAVLDLDRRKLLVFLTLAEGGI